MSKDKQFTLLARKVEALEARVVKLEKAKKKAAPKKK